MGKLLTARQVEAFARDGFVFPVRVLSTGEAARCLAAYEDYERKAWGCNGRAFDDAEGREYLRHPQRRARWAYDLVTHPRVLDAIEDLLGPDVLIRNSKLWVKPPGSKSVVTWHQDFTYDGLRPVERTLSAWVAITYSGPENGCIRYIPGSHGWGDLKHVRTDGEHNLLNFGQVLERPVDSEAAVAAVLQPGEMTIHHTRIVHESLANRSPHMQRIGLGIGAVAPEVVESDERLAAILARGVDRHGHFQRFEWPAEAAT